MNTEQERATYQQEVMPVRGFDKEFQDQVEEYRRSSDKGTVNQATRRDRNDQMENVETRRDSNN